MILAQKENRRGDFFCGASGQTADAVGNLVAWGYLLPAFAAFRWFSNIGSGSLLVSSRSTKFSRNEESVKIPRPPHNWTITPRQAIAIQKKLSPAVSQARPTRKIRLVAGLDAAFSEDKEHCIGGVVLWDLESRTVIEQHTAVQKIRMPYIPGLLSFLEAPSLLAALRKLHRRPDLLICDGQGIAHPRRLGIASHIGLLIDIPTLGCAKSRLIGDHQELGPQKGSGSPLRDKGEIVGTVLRTRDKVKPVFVSVGHKIDLATAERIVLECAVAYRLPEPTRLADQLVAAAKRKRHRREPGK
jgi:deoxyribonuclease V